jgi:hypothetical protein
MAGRIFIVSFSILLLFVFYPNALRSQQISGSGLAKVKAEILHVRSENFPTSDIVKVLKKGDVVWIQMEIIGSGGKWCLISEETKKTSLGFVFCEDLVYLDRNSNITEQPVRKEKTAAPLAEGLGSLLQAIWKGDIFAVKELVEKGVDPNAQTKLGISPLHMAAKKQGVENTMKSLARAFKSNSDVSELQIKLGNHSQIFQMLKEVGGRE